MHKESLQSTFVKVVLIYLNTTFKGILGNIAKLYLSEIRLLKSINV